MSAMHAFRRNDSDLEQVTAEDRRNWSLRYLELQRFCPRQVLFVTS